MIDVKDPAFEKLVSPSAPIEKIASGFQFTEGPVFSRIGYLLFSDIPPTRIVKWEKGEVSVFRENSNGANGLTFDHQGRLLACEQGRVTRTEKDGKITVLAEGYSNPNDLVYAIDGSIYFSELRGRNNPGPSAVHQITRKGQVRVVSSDCERPNGVALGPNQQKLYIADSGQKNVRVYEIAPDGALGKGRIFSELKSDEPGVPDGLKTDEEGNVWVTGPGGVWVFNSAGKHLGTIKPPEIPSNCGWGDGFLYITARTSVYRIRTKAHGTRTF